MTAFRYVLDTSAVLAVVLGEAQGRTVLEILKGCRERSEEVGLPFMALMEVEYKLLRQVRKEEVEASLAMVGNWPVEIVESTPEWRHEAARIKTAGGLSLADAWMAARAMLSDAELIHMDREFDKVAGLKSVKL